MMIISERTHAEHNLLCKEQPAFF